LKLIHLANENMHVALSSSMLTLGVSSCMHLGITSEQTLSSPL